MERMCERREMIACEGEWGSVGGSGKGTVMGGLYRWGDFQRVSWRGVREGGLGGVEKDSEDKGEREK